MIEQDRKTGNGDIDDPGNKSALANTQSRLVDQGVRASVTVGPALMWQRGLSRQLLAVLALASVSVVALVFFGSWVVYGLIYDYFPWTENNSGWIPSEADYLTLTVFLCLALAIAFSLSVKLASRILVPLNSLTESARRIAAGDLSARAIPGDHSLGETANLVSDFNTMAQNLQNMSNDMATWNATVAHELRTPLTILRGRLQGLLDEVFVPDKKTIQNLLLQVEGLSSLVNDLNLITLAGSGRMNLHVQSVALARQIQSVVDLVSPSLIEAGFTLELKLIDVNAVVDPVRVRQALVALLDNAKRYANPGRIEIELEQRNDAAVIRLEDAGPGLQAEFAKYAFTPFARGESSRSRAHGGSGLGLSVVHAIAKAHGGGANYHASDQGGAVFEIMLPIGQTTPVLQEPGGA